MANTGMRHGTEALNLMWKHVTLFVDGGQQYLEMSVSGKRYELTQNQLKDC